MTRDDPKRDAEDLVIVLDPERECALIEALRAAYAPAALDAKLNEELIEQALEDTFALASPEEARQSERLREALDGTGQHPDLDLLRALRAAAAPAPLSEERLASAAAQATNRRRGNVVYIAFGVASIAAAIAAGVLLVVGPAPERAELAASAASLPAELAVSRSTVPLFNEKFDTASTTERIDKIALARKRELRENRYLAWGLR
jgi:hypothetical protein